MTASASDSATPANTRTETRTYTVDEWTLKGFFQPVDMDGILNGVKGGSTVPLKFEVFAGSTELTNTTAVDGFVVKGIACPGATVATDDIELTTTGGTSLRYDATAGQFIQNWQTPKKAGACYEVTMKTHGRVDPERAVQAQVVHRTADRVPHAVGLGTARTHRVCMRRSSGREAASR